MNKIDIRDLRVGNWVNIYSFPNNNPQEKDLFPTKVVSILHGLPNENLNTVECVIPKEGGGYGLASRPADTLLPIPLTAEILEKNGFKYDEFPKFAVNEISEKTKVMFSYHSGSKTIFVEIDKPNFHLTDTCVLYVHELQHLVRDARIDKEITL